MLCATWRRVGSFSRASLSSSERPQASARTVLCASSSASTSMARVTESFAILRCWASCNQRARRSTLRCSVVLELAEERPQCPPELTGLPAFGDGVRRMPALLPRVLVALRGAWGGAVVPRAGHSQYPSAIWAAAPCRAATPCLRPIATPS
jgi:hypothetical protein